VVVPDSFTYEANGNPLVFATVSLGAQALEAGAGISVVGQSYASKLATFISVKAPGLLTGAVDSLGYPLSAVYAGGSLPACPANADPTPPCVAVDPSGGFNAYVTGATFSTNFPTSNPFQASKAADTDSFIFKISEDPGGSDSATLFVPIVVSTAGLNNSFFTSELVLTNRGTKNATLEFTYTSAIGSGSGTATDLLGAGQQWIFRDAIDYLRSIGMPIMPK
jgi:hypothetical protein